MSERFGQTAILVFTRTPVQEAVSKTFDPNTGKNGNQAIAHRLIRQTVATARSTRLPVFVYYDKPNKLESFGVHLAQAFESVFAKGFSKVIAVGNDCPDLSVDLILRASSRLSEQKLVLGPATDGGVYLIGMHQIAYERHAFIDLPWETAQLQAGWKQYLAVNPLGIVWLESFSDIDHPADFKALLNRLPQWSLLKKQLLSVLASMQIPLAFDRWDIPPVALICATPLRGPPL